VSVTRKILISILAVGAAFILTIIAFLANGAWKSHSFQANLDAFYATPEEFSEIPGTLLRFEPLGAEVANAQAYRMLYVTEGQQGNSAVAAGMAFIPDKKSDSPRPVVAYVAGTTGQGNACAPSRSPDPTSGVKHFLPEAIAKGGPWSLPTNMVWGLRGYSFI